MRSSISKLIRLIAVDLENEGDIVKKFRAKPKIKPPRREPAVKNKSNRSDYMKNYMEDYREEGKDYQRKPELIKKLRKKQRQHSKKKKMEVSGNVGIGLDYPVHEFYVTDANRHLYID